MTRLHDQLEILAGADLVPYARNSRTHSDEQVAQLAAGQQPVLVIVASYPTEAEARARESAECHAHRDSITNLHDPAKGAADFAHQKPAP